MFRSDKHPKPIDKIEFTGDDALAEKLRLLRLPRSQRSRNIVVSCQL